MELKLNILTNLGDKMERKEPDFADNVFVKRNKWGGNEFFSIWIKFDRDEWDMKETYEPISISRYCVPGRIDTYNFSWWDRPSGYGDRVTYYSEGHTPLPQVMKMLQRDLDRPFVIGLMKEAARKINLYQLNHFIRFLEQLAPSSKSVRSLNTIQKTRKKEWEIKIKKDREQKIKEARELLSEKV